MRNNILQLTLTIILMLSGITTISSQDNKNDDTESRCQSFLDKAEALRREASYSKSIEYYIKVKECVGDKEYSPFFVQACVGLGNIYNDIYDTYEAVNQFKEGINHQILFKTIEPVTQMYMRDGIGKSLINYGDFKTAIKLIDLSVKMAKLSNDKIFEIESLNNLIYLLALEGNVKEAEKHLSTLNLLTIKHKTPEKLTSLIEASKLSISILKDLNKAKKEILNFKFDTLKTINLTTKERFLRLKHQIDLQESNKSKMLESYAKWDNFKDSIQIDFYKTFKDSLQIRAQKRSIDEELFQLKTQDQLNQTEIDYKNKNILYLISLLVAFILIIILTYSFLRRFKKQKEVIESLQKELHHRIKNNLSIIDTFIEVAKEEFEDSKFSNKLTELQNRIDSINEVHQQLYKNKDVTNLNIKNYIDTLSSNVESSFSNSKITIEKSVQNKLQMHADKSFSVGLIINEFLTNSYKYAFGTNEGKVKIEMNDLGSGYQLLLSDNGKGLPENLDLKTSETFGLRIMKLLTEQLNGEFRLSNKEGVNLTINFPK